MPHTKKWTDAHAKLGTLGASTSKTIYGYTADQWDAAKTQFAAHLYTGTEASLNDQPIDPGDDTTPNSIVAEVTARSEKGASYVKLFADAGLLYL